MTDRTTIVSSDTILSADQNDRVHAAATKAMGKMGDDSTALIMSSSSKTMTPADGDVDAETAPATGQPSDDDDESHLLDPSPFLKIFGRLKGQSASVSKRAVPKSNAKVTPAEKRPKTQTTTPTPTTTTTSAGGEKGGRNRKRNAPEQEDDGEKGSDIFGVKAPVPAGTDDSELISSYQTQLDALQQLDVEGSSDQVFGPWCKSRLAKLGELKTGGLDLSHITRLDYTILTRLTRLY